MKRRSNLKSSERNTQPVNSAKKLKNTEDFGATSISCPNSKYTAVLLKGKVQLRQEDTKGVKSFPADKSQGRILCHALTTDFFHYGTDSGHVVCVSLKDGKTVSSFTHTVGVREVFPAQRGKHLVFADEKKSGYLLSTSTESDSCLELPDFSPTITGVLWDSWHPERGVFAAYDHEKVYVYALHKLTIYGSWVSLVGSECLHPSKKPMSLENGVLTCQLASGQTSKLTLSTHSYLKQAGSSSSKLSKQLTRAVMLNRLDEGLDLVRTHTKERLLKKLGKACLIHMEVELAIQVYQLSQNVSMVSSLEAIRGIKENKLLAGHLAVFLGEYNLAQDHYLSSSCPLAALEMRRDLSHWEKALKLAKDLAEDQIPYISKEYAAHLEQTGDFLKALAHYKNGLTHNNQEHNEACQAGVARMLITVGDIRGGVAKAIQHPSRVLKQECGALLESVRQLSQAAQLYEMGQYYDQAALVYIQCKDWAKVGELLPHVSSLKTHQRYAKAMEANGKYKVAAQAYKRAEDWDNLTRILLDHLNNPEAAVHVVRQTKSKEGAKMVARVFLLRKNYDSAIRILVLCQCNDEAFKLAQQHRQVEVFAEIIGAEATQDDYGNIARYFEAEKNHLQAGYYFHLGEQYRGALENLLMCDSTEDGLAVDMAIEVVCQAKDICLTDQLIDYLTGKTDSKPKDPVHLFRLYMALQRHTEAAHVANSIASEQLCSGNYRVSHDLLFKMYRELLDHKTDISTEMSTNLMLLHSYLLAKIHVKRGDHLKAAHLLSRVSENIRMFPAHVVPILTSAVIECQRAGLRNSAFNHAVTLMRPDNRKQIQQKYKRKIEDIVRHPHKSEVVDDMTPCPVCGSLLPQNELLCTSCKSNLPYCIATGQHMLREDWSVCPHCDFPALHSQFLLLLKTEKACPMCCQTLGADEVKKISDCSKYLATVNLNRRTTASP
ncbi:WD repeat-containing protein 19-like [Aulostomus maculatus]